MLRLISREKFPWQMGVCVILDNRDHTFVEPCQCNPYVRLWDINHLQWFVWCRHLCPYSLPGSRGCLQNCSLHRWSRQQLLQDGDLTTTPRDLLWLHDDDTNGLGRACQTLKTLQCPSEHCYNTLLLQQPYWPPATRHSLRCWRGTGQTEWCQSWQSTRVWPGALLQGHRTPRCPAAGLGHWTICWRGEDGGPGSNLLRRCSVHSPYHPL